MIVRRSAPSELHLLTQLFDYDEPDEMIESVSRDIESGVADVFVMFDGESLIGELHAAYVSNDERAVKGRRAYLFAFRVRSGYRGRGLGRELMRSVLDELSAQGYTEFTIGAEDDNHIARHIYEDFGFTELISRKTEEYQGERCEYGLYLRRG